MAEFGFWDDGDVMVSIPSDSPLYEIKGYDRVTMINRTEPFSMSVITGVNDSFKFHVTQVDSVQWINSGGTLENGFLPNIIDGALSWDIGTAPNDGGQYTLSGRRHPEYFCYQDQPLDRPHQFGEPLPRRIVLKRFDTFGR